MLTLCSNSTAMLQPRFSPPGLLGGRVFWGERIGNIQNLSNSANLSEKLKDFICEMQKLRGHIFITLKFGKMIIFDLEVKKIV